MKEMNLVPIKEVDFKLMPNDQEFYFVLDLAGGKRVHRGGHIKANPTNFTHIVLGLEQHPISTPIISEPSDEKIRISGNTWITKARKRKKEETDCAKLRNQLSPFYNLVSMLHLNHHNGKITQLIMREALQCEENKVEINRLLASIENSSPIEKQISEVEAVEFGNGIEDEEIEEPVGKFIIDNLSIEKRVITPNGMYVHYSDICKLLKEYAKSNSRTIHIKKT